MSMSMCCCLQLECSVCEHPINGDPRSNLKLAFDGNGNDPISVALLLIQSGCCPLCGTRVTGHGQTPDEVLERYNEYLLEQLEEPNPDELFVEEQFKE